jgi:hypothetical protein
VAFPFSLSDPAFTAIGNVSVSLNLSGGYNGDRYAYLSHGNGFSVLLNRVGRVDQNEDGYGNPGFAVTLSAKVLLDIHEYQSLSPSYNSGGQLTGVWAADGRNVDPATAAPTFNAAPARRHVEQLQWNGPERELDAVSCRSVQRRHLNPEQLVDLGNSSAGAGLDWPGDKYRPLPHREGPKARRRRLTPVICDFLRKNDFREPNSIGHSESTAHRLARNPPRGPGRLKIKPAR